MCERACVRAWVRVCVCVSEGNSAALAFRAPPIAPKACNIPREEKHRFHFCESSKGTFAYSPSISNCLGIFMVRGRAEVQEPSPTLQTRRKSTLLRKMKPETQWMIASETDTENPSATSSPRPNCWRYFIQATLALPLVLHKQIGWLPQ